VKDLQQIKVGKTRSLGKARKKIAGERRMAGSCYADPKGLDAEKILRQGNALDPANQARNLLHARRSIKMHVEKGSRRTQEERFKNLVFSHRVYWKGETRLVEQKKKCCGEKLKGSRKTEKSKA